MDFFKEILEIKNADPTPQTRMKTAALATAVVKENWNEELPGYVKVEYVIGEPGSSSSGWIRVLNSYAGNGYGSYTMPEIGSEVLVGFIMGDLSNAVVLGCLYNDSNQLPENTANKENTIKRIVTKGGHEIIFDEEKDKEKLEIKTPGGLTITMEDENQTIEIKEDTGKNTVLINGKDEMLSIKAGKKIELISGNAKLILDGSSNKAELSASQITAEAKQSLQITGQNLKLEGTVTEIKGKSTMKLESSGIAEVKGSLLKLN